MRKLSAKNCLVAGCTVSCLSLILIILIAAISFSKINFEDILDKSFFNKNTQKTNLGPQDKGIVLSVGLVSDSESDWDYLELALSELKERGIKDVFHLGDITHLGVPSDFVEAKNIFTNSGLNVYPVPGDRDLWKSKGLEAFSNVFSQSYGVIEVSGIKFLLINNSDEYEGIDETQMAYISENIPSSKFVLLHNPLYFGVKSIWGKGMGEYSASVDSQRQELLKLIRSTSTVSAVFAGDQHLFSENLDDSSSNSLFHYVVGAINSERNIERPNVAILTVYDDGDYYVQKVSL